MSDEEMRTHLEGQEGWRLVNTLKNGKNALFLLERLIPRR